MIERGRGSPWSRCDVQEHFLSEACVLAWAFALCVGVLGVRRPLRGLSVYVIMDGMRRSYCSCDFSSRRLIRNSTPEFLVFTAQEGGEGIEISETASSSQRAGWPRLALSVVAVIVGIPGFVAAGAGFPNVKAVAFGATSLIIASVIGCFALVWNVDRRDAIMSAMLLAGALGLAFIAVYAVIHYQEIHETSIRGDSSPSARRQALALICGPAIAGLWFLLLGLGAMRKARKKGGGDKKEPEARESQRQEQEVEENSRQS